MKDSGIQIMERYGKARAAVDFFKCPVVGPPCDLTRILGDVLVCVIESLSRSGRL